MLRTWGPLLGMVLASCGGVADHQQSSTTNEVNGQAAGAEGNPERGGARASDGDEPAAGGEPAMEASGGANGEESAAGGAPGEDAAGSSGGGQPEQGCDDVCADLEECTGKPLAGCNDRCTQSIWVELHDLHCLALRVYWINEEGCEVMLQTYSSFEPDDDCAD